MATILIIIIIAVGVILAVSSIAKAKRNGKACMGCPDAAFCRGDCQSRQKRTDHEDNFR